MEETVAVRRVGVVGGRGYGAIGIYWGDGWIWK